MNGPYEMLGTALRTFIKKFDAAAPREKLESEMERILALAEEIGEPLQEDTEELRRDFHHFLAKRGDPRSREQLLNQALRLEQETREL